MANMTSSVSASQVAGELASATFEEIPALVEHYREDPRQQVIKACERALKRHAKESERGECSRLAPSWNRSLRFISKFTPFSIVWL